MTSKTSSLLEMHLPLEEPSAGCLEMDPILYIALKIAADLVVLRSSPKNGVHIWSDNESLIFREDGSINGREERLRMALNTCRGVMTVDIIGIEIGILVG